MKLLAASDIHKSMNALYSINSAIENHDPDVLVLCGDITHFGDKEWADHFLESINIDDIFGVIGNCDPEQIKEAYKDNAGNYLHLKKLRREGLEFIGLSGSNYSEDEVEEFMKKGENSDIVVLHAPPYGYNDDAARNKHIGERSVLKAIDKIDPRLVLTGHVHEDKGTVKEGGTIYVNPGPASNGNLSLIEIEGNDEIKVKHL